MDKWNHTYLILILTVQCCFQVIDHANGGPNPPFFDPQVTIFNATEDKFFQASLEASDPDGDSLVWSISGNPKWVTFNEGSLTGTPGNDYVGWNNFSVSAASEGGEDTINISIMVENSPPFIVERSRNPMAWEGSVYSSGFDLREDGSMWKVLLRLRGPVEEQWATVFRNGTVLGTPENRHVGNWTFDLTLDDGNGGFAYVQWNVLVVNEKPVIFTPSTIKAPEKEWLYLDFNCTGEGDGLTGFSLVSGPAGAVINGETGLVSWFPDNVWGSFTFRVRVDDGHGDSSTLDHTVAIMDLPVKLLTNIPSVFVAGEEFLLDIDVDEEDPPWTSYRLNGTVSFFNTNQNGISFTSTGMISGRPWNMDVGTYYLELQFFNDHMGGSPILVGVPKWTYEWTFSVVPNSSFVDPSFDFTVESMTDRVLVLNFTSSSGSLSINRTQVIIHQNGTLHTQVARIFKDGIQGSVDIDISGLNGTLVIIAAQFSVSTAFMDRAYSKVQEVEKPAPEGGENIRNGQFPWWIIVPVILLTLFIMAIILALVEKTSYAFQTILFRNGSPVGEEVLSKVQDQPGIRFREICRAVSTDRRDLVHTLLKLEEEGNIRSVEDGRFVRFLPTVGSFVEGPLVLNDNQVRIARVLGDAGSRTYQKLREETGLSSRILDRELSLLELKGVLTRRPNAGYFMSSGQKKRFVEWMGRAGKR